MVRVSARASRCCSRTCCPVWRSLDRTLPPQDLLDAAVEANVRWSMHQLLDTPEVKKRMREGIVKLVGAVYELKTGRVRFLA